MTFESLSTSERNGVIVVAVFALLSALAFAFIAFRTLRLATIPFFERDDTTSRPPEILFFRTQLGHYAGCLILSNMFISVAGLINFAWVSHSGLSLGSTCSAQAVLMQIGVWGTCWFMGAHGAHTLSSLGFHIPPPRWRSSAGVAVGWIIAFIAGLVPLRKSGMYGPIGTTCAITVSYPGEIFALEAFPIILSAFVSAVVYSVIFLILHGKLSANFGQKLRSSNSANQRGEERCEEYRKFICMIIRSMFWFPFAFVLLCFPFCITHILMYTGYAVPSASNVFADACISMLGFVNVGLLCNTFRVIAPACVGPCAAGVVAETKTFRNDASSGLPTAPQSGPSRQSSTPSHERRYPAYNSTQIPSGHSHDSSWSSANSNTELLGVEKVTYQSTRGKVVPFNIKRQGTGHSPLTRENSSFQPMAGTNAIVKEPTSRPTAPPARNLGSAEIANKSATLALRLGVSVEASGTTSQAPAILPYRELEKGKAAVSATSIHQLEEVDVRGPAHVDVSTSRPFSSTSTMTNLSVDNDWDYHGVTMHTRKIRPLSRISEPSSEEQNDTVVSYPHPAQRLSARSCRTSTTTVWSQETGYTLSQPWDAERREAYRQLTANALGPGVMARNRGDIGEVVGRPAAALPNPRARSRPLLRPIKIASKVSASFSSMLSPKPSSRIPSVIIIGPSDSIV